jgi:hypothetical protein
MVARLERLAREAPHAQVVLVEVREFAAVVRDDNTVARRFERRLHYRKRVGKLARSVLEGFVCPDQVLLGPLAREQDAARILERD